jgi:membrane protease YdiL (CAAX protease family)
VTGAMAEVAYERPAPASGAALGLARRALPAYAVWAASVEAVVAFVDETAGAILAALLLFVLLSHYVIAIHRLPAGSLGRSPAERLLDLLPLLALLPLLRLLSLTVPVDGASVITWIAMVGVPLLGAALLTMRALELDAAAVGLTVGSWAGQLQIALAGVPLGLSAYVILRPDAAAAEGAAGWVAGLPVIVVFAGLTLELVFRGLLQRGLVEVMGRSGILVASALFAASFLGTRSAEYILFMGLVGGVLGWSYHRTGSIVGISVAHGLLNVGLLLLWPALLG